MLMLGTTQLINLESISLFCFILLLLYLISKEVICTDFAQHCVFRRKDKNPIARQDTTTSSTHLDDFTADRPEYLLANSFFP